MRSVDGHRWKPSGAHRASDPSFYAFAPSFIFAIYPLFLRSRGLNQFEVNTVAGTCFLVTFLTDVPTGAFADAIGRRDSVVLGCALHVAAFILYFFSYHYWHFIVAEIVDGVATTFGNGAIDARESGTRGPRFPCSAQTLVGLRRPELRNLCPPVRLHNCREP